VIVPSDACPDAATAAALQARDGNPDAIETLVRATQVDVWRFAASLVGVQAADDVTQDTYLRAVRALPQFAGRSTARTWLLAICRRACVDHIRTVARLRRLHERVQVGDGSVPDESGMRAVNELLDRLPHERRVAFVLTQLLGLSYQEAADVEQLPIGTIRSRVARARADLVAAYRAAEVS
jgi:RNA polymerase sigma-70 factor (ECF subfamily)